MKRTLIAPMFMILPLLSCSSDNAPLTGSWVEPANIGAAGTVQGFELLEDGTARSINMSTLVWKSWQRIGNDLIMNGESIGNGMSFEFSDTLRIDRLNADSLILLGREGRSMGFGRAQ